MIPVAVVLAGLVLVGHPAQHLRAERTRPQDHARLGAVGMAGGLALLVAGFWLLAAPAFLGSAGRDAADPLCRWLFGHATPGGTAGAVVAAALGTILPFRFVRSLWRSTRLRRRAVADPIFTSRISVEGHDVAVVPVAASLAFASTRAPARVVVSQGLIDGLDDDGLAAVVRHEAAHLRHRHSLALMLARGVASALAPLRTPAAGAMGVELALERWADESASGPATTRRRVLRKAILRTAVLAGRGNSVLVGLRCSALLREPPSVPTLRRVSLYAVGLVVSLVALASILVVATDTHGPLGLLSLCG